MSNLLGMSKCDALNINATLSSFQAMCIDSLIQFPSSLRDAQQIQCRVDFSSSVKCFASTTAKRVVATFASVALAEEEEEIFVYGPIWINGGAF